jgi:uncharacterized protein
MNSLRTTALQPHSFPGPPESRVVAIRHETGRAPIKADRGAQLRLLDLQTIDSAVAQLEHRRKTLPEHAEINALNAAVATTSADLVAAETAVRDLEAEQDRAEAELQPVRERLSRNQTRIADGSIADPKALSSMVEEVGHLQRRISDLEDAELEIMEQLESAAASLERLRIRAGELDQQLADAVTRRDHALAALEVQVDQHRAERAELSPLLPADLLALYDKIGASHNGVGAAELRQRRCTGCQLEVNAADLGTFAAAADDDVLRCEECSRILVRTASSGL